MTRCCPISSKAERWEGGADAYRGGDGPLNTQLCKYQDELIEAFAAASRSAGFPQTDDYNGAQQEGFGRLQMTIDNGRRASTATAYLRPALKRPNLTVRDRRRWRPASCSRAAAPPASSIDTAATRHRAMASARGDPRAAA